MFALQGDCSNGESCRFIHDASAVPQYLSLKEIEAADEDEEDLCVDMLRNGHCPSGASCSFSHDLDKIRKFRVKLNQNADPENRSKPTCLFGNDAVDPKLAQVKATSTTADSSRSSKFFPEPSLPPMIPVTQSKANPIPNQQTADGSTGAEQGL